jgi:hypothetical protein
MDVPQDAWPEVLRIAQEHKLSNLVCSRWVETVPTVPAEIANKRRQAAIQNMLMLQALCEVIDLFDAHGLPVLPFKGPLLAETVFGDLINRNFGDIDILVPEDQLVQATYLLVQLGYRPVYDVDLADYIALVQRGGGELVLRQDRFGVVLELHRELSNHYALAALTFARVQSQLERTCYGGRQVLNLGAEAGLVYLCIHGAKEYWRQLDHVVCVAWHLDRRPPDWDKTLLLARQWGVLNSLLMGLGLSAVLFKSELPSSIRQLLKKDQAVARLVQQQSEYIFSKDRLTLLRFGKLFEFLRMHWVQINSAPHFLRWMTAHLFLPRIDDVAAGRVSPHATGWRAVWARLNVYLSRG